MEIQGVVDPLFAPVAEVFAATLPTGPQTGSAFAVELGGRWVVDLWGGTASADGRRAWERDSIVQPYSVSKSFAAMCALVLVDDGLLDLDAPVQRYWPQFRAGATVRHVLEHSAGVVALAEAVPTETFYDWDRLCSLLAATEPAWPPGTQRGESAVFYGHLVGELVRRVSGKTLGAVLRERICAPLGLDFAFGLSPAEERRAVDLTTPGDEFHADRMGERPSLYRRAISNPPGAWDLAVVNGSRWRRAEIPAVNGHGTARAVAGLFAALRDSRLLSPGLLLEATAPRPTEEDLVMGGPRAWGFGVQVEDDGFGMGGSGGSLGWTMREGYAMGFVTGSLADHTRVDQIENCVRECLGLPPL